MNARDAIAVEVHRRHFNVDEVVATIAFVLLVVLLIGLLLWGYTHPMPQIASCYQPTEARK